MWLCATNNAGDDDRPVNNSLNIPKLCHVRHIALRHPAQTPACPCSKLPSQVVSISSSGGPIMLAILQWRRDATFLQLHKASAMVQARRGGCLPGQTNTSTKTVLRSRASSRMERVL